jgi:two-component system nitrogen regulation sensor histidine kinase NtrY
MGSRPTARVLAKSRSLNHRIAFERRLRWLCVLLSTPGAALAAWIAWREHLSAGIALVFLGLLALFALIVTAILLEQTIRPLQTLSNVIGAIREEDFSFRARGQHRGDALGELAIEINQFADFLQQQRVGGMEATALLQRVVSSMDAPVLTFDPRNRLRLINPAALRLLSAQLASNAADPALLQIDDPIGYTAAELGLEPLLRQADGGIVALPAAANARISRWLVHRNTFRQRGVPHTLLVLSDVSVALREEERTAFQRLVRVLGHEINNSLTPIKSIAGSMRALAFSSSTEPPSGTALDLDRGLRIIESRADSLQRFVQGYRQLAQLPLPNLRPTPVRSLLERVRALETRLNVSLYDGPDMEVMVDPDQLEQLLINLVRNAAEAAIAAHQENGSETWVALEWQQKDGALEITIDDNGLGISNASNLFVPFYTTKPGGTGVGLLLARQIAEGHGGTVDLRSRDQGGCRATVLLPTLSSH